MRHLVLSVALCLCGAVLAAETAPLLRFLEDKGAPQLDAALALRAEAVSIDLSLLRPGGPAVFSLELLDGRQYTAVREAVEVRAADDWSWRGRLLFGGVDEGVALITVVQGHVSGLFYGVDGVFSLTPTPAGHRLVEVDPSPAADCALLAPRFVSPPGLPPLASGYSSWMPPEKMTATIDVLVLYTQRSRTSTGGAGAIRSLVQNAADAMNNALNNSQVDARIRLVHVAQTDRQESTQDMVEDLIWLSTDRSVANLRRTHRADLVALIVDQVVDNTGGIAWGMFRPNTLGRNAAAFGFSVTVRSLAVGNLTFAHELGHNLGLHHNPAHAPPPNQIFAPYAYGHFVANTFRTIMATNASCSGCPRQPNYSNPGVTVLGGQATGIVNQRDNHRVLDRTAAIVARHGAAAGDLGFGADGVTVDEAAGVLRVDVFRFAGSIGTVTVDYATEDGTATAGSDYQAVSGTLAWENGEAVTFSADGNTAFFVPKTLEIPILDDFFQEEDETFRVHLSNPGGGAALRLATLEITLVNDDDTPPSDRLDFQTTSLATVEGSTVMVTVTRTGFGFGPLTVEYQSADGTARAEDYTPTVGALRWEEGDLEPKTFALTTLADSRVEGPETVALALIHPTGNAVLGSRRFAVVTVEDEDTAPTGGVVAFAARRVFSREGAGTVPLSVLRNGTSGPLGALSIAYVLRAASTATEGVDHGLVNGTVTFAADEVVAEILVPVLDDAAVEGNETLEVALVEASLPPGTALGQQDVVTLTLLDDDGPGAVLSPELVACDEARLEGLLRRLALTGPPPGVKSAGLNLTYTRSGDFAGLAYTGNGPFTPEQYLAFSTNPEESPLLRNPARTPLASVSLSRYRPSSEIVPSFALENIQLQLNPTLDLENPDPAALLQLDNRETPEGTPTDSKPGRGLAPLVEPCHSLFTGEDQHIFRVLARLVRSTAGPADSDGTKTAIFRGEEAGTYRINLYPRGRLEQRLATLLEIETLQGGAPERATLRVLPPCSGDQTSNCTALQEAIGVQLVPPVLHEFWEETGEFVFHDPSIEGGAGRDLTPVDWTDLLAGTTWRRTLASVASVASVASGATMESLAALTAEQVACDQARLTGLLARATSSGAGLGSGLNLALTQSGDFAGLVYTPPNVLESLLAFSTNPEETSLLLNPQRPQLFGISVSRNPLSSDLIDARAGQGLRLTLNPTLELENPDPANLLELNSLVGPSGRATSAKPGRGLADLVVSCHQGYSAQDVHVLRVLTRVVRAETIGAQEHHIALFRDQTTDSYRIDVLPFGADGTALGRLSARLVVTYASGALATGTLTLLPPCGTPDQLHCTQVGQRTEVRLVRPTNASSFPPTDGPRVWSDGAADAQTSAAVDWNLVLAGSTWATPAL